MFKVNIKCLCLHYVEIDQVKSPQLHKFPRIVHYQRKYSLFGCFNNLANSACANFMLLSLFSLIKVFCEPSK